MRISARRLYSHAQAFPCGEELAKGKMPDSFIETYHRIVTEFFPRSTQYEYAENVEFEVYSSADVSDPNYRYEIRIAVKEKTE